MISIRVRFLFQLSCLAAASSGLSTPNAAASALFGNSLSVNPINADTGAVGSSITFSGGGSTSYADLAAEPNSQGVLLWGTTGKDLVALNPVTQQLVSSLTFSGATGINSLAIDPVNGDFYGATTTNLYRIAPATGIATLVGPTALGVSKALGFDLAGNLYGIANEKQLVAVTKSTGATSLIASLAVNRMEDIAARPETGVMYGIGYDGDYNLFQINLTTGALVKVGPSLSRPNGLAFTTAPEPSSLLLATWAVVVFVASMRRVPLRTR